MKITKETEGIVKENFRYRYEGDLITGGNLVIDLDMGLYVTGSIKAGGSIKVGWSIEAGESIKAGGYIEAGRSIKAGEYIKAGGSIEAGWSIKADGSIEAGRFIKADGSIEAGENIKAGELAGIVTGLGITCSGALNFGLRLFAGTCNWRKITDADKTVTCGKLGSGTIEYGILVETGLEDKVEDKTEEAIKLLKEKGYRIVKN